MTSAPKLSSSCSRFTVYEAVRWRSSDLVTSTGIAKRSRSIVQSAAEFSSFLSNMKSEMRSSVTYSTVDRGRQQIMFLLLRNSAWTNSPIPMHQLVSTRMYKRWGSNRSNSVIPLPLSPSCLRNPFAQKGTSLREIADFLGHRNLKTVSIYARLDTRALRKVASFSMAGVL